MSGSKNDIDGTSLLLYAGIFLVHAACFYPLCADSKSNRLHLLWMAMFPTLAAITYDLSENEALRGPFAVAVILLLIISGIGSFFGWPVILDRAMKAQPYGEDLSAEYNSGLTTYTGRSGFVLLIPGVSAIAALLFSFWFRWRKYLGFRVFSESVFLPVTLRLDPRLAWMSGLLVFAIACGLLWNYDHNQDSMRDLVLATCLLVLSLSCFKPYEVVLFPDRIDVPTFLFKRKTILYRDIVAVEATAIYARALRIDSYLANGAVVSTYVGKVVDSMSDLALFLQKKADMARSVDEKNLESVPTSMTTNSTYWFRRGKNGVGLFPGAGLGWISTLLFFGLLACTVFLLPDLLERGGGKLLYALVVLEIVGFVELVKRKSEPKRREGSN